MGQLRRTENISGLDAGLKVEKSKGFTVGEGLKEYTSVGTGSINKRMTEFGKLSGKRMQSCQKVN